MSLLEAPVLEDVQSAPHPTTHAFGTARLMSSNPPQTHVRHVLYAQTPILTSGTDVFARKIVHYVMILNVLPAMVSAHQQAVRHASRRNKEILLHRLRTVYAPQENCTTQQHTRVLDVMPIVPVAQGSITLLAMLVPQETINKLDRQHVYRSVPLDGLHSRTPATVTQTLSYS